MGEGCGHSDLLAVQAAWLQETGQAAPSKTTHPVGWINCFRRAGIGFGYSTVRRWRTFRDRTEAGHVLAAEIASLLDGSVVVAAIPRGGVPVARAVAETLGARLGFVHARKLVVPRAGESAVGAVDEEGYALFDELALDALGVHPGDLEAAQIRAARQIGWQLGRGGGPSLPGLLTPDAQLVLVDDGLATGWTMRAALAYARRHGARRVTVAAPCASEPAAEYFREHAERFLCPIVDEALLVVGQYYEDFSPVDEAQMKPLSLRPVPADDRVTTTTGQRVAP